MYINDVHIAYYIGAVILSLIVGQLVDWANKRLPEYKSFIFLRNKIYINCKFRFNKIYDISTNVIVSIYNRL